MSALASGRCGLSPAPPWQRQDARQSVLGHRLAESVLDALGLKAQRTSSHAGASARAPGRRPRHRCLLGPRWKLRASRSAGLLSSSDLGLGRLAARLGSILNGDEQVYGTSAKGHLGHSFVWL